MTSGRIVHAAGWTVLVGGLVASVAAVVAPLDRRAAASRALPDTTADALQPAAPADSVAQAVVARDLFRFGRRPSPVLYDPQRGAGQGGPPPVPKPGLRLVGLVGGAAPMALIEGLPGIEGARAARPGEVIAGLRVAAIGNGQVRVVGLDTSWTLALRRQ